MQKIISFAIFLLVASCATAQPFDCSKYKEGKFRIADANAGGITIIERKGGYQVESNEGLKIIIRLSVTWLDNCNYELRFDKILRNDNKIDLPRTTLRVRIIETREDGYVQETSSAEFPGVYRSEVTIVK